MDFKIQKKNFCDYLNIGTISGIQLGIFFWLAEVIVILWNEGGLIQLFSNDNIVWQLFIVGIIYSLIGTAIGIILGIIRYIISSQGRREFLSSLYFPFLGGLIFFFITLLNIYYIWSPNILKKPIIVKSGLILIVSISALFLGHIIFYSEKKKFSAILYFKWFSDIVKPQKRKAKYLFLVSLIFVSGLIFLTSKAKQGEVIKNGHSQKSMSPSIILIVVDTLRADHLSCLGYPDLITPNIDSFAKNSILFTNAYTQAPSTRPSIATLLTALYPSSHGLNIGSRLKRMGYPGRMILSKKALTLPEYLKDSGYYTAGFTTNATIGPDFGFAQGYDEYYFLDKPIINRFSLFEWTTTVFNSYLKNNFYINAETLVERASIWLASNKTRPFFLYLHFMDPHRPYLNKPEKLWSKTISTYMKELIKEKKDLYHNDYKSEIVFTDHHIGKLLERIRSMGIYDNAIIVVTSDHGEEFLEHGGWDHAHTLYEELLRVPLLIKTPNLGQGRIDYRLVGLVDIFPTILRILGLEVPIGLQGEPIIDLRGKPLKNKSYIFAERLPSSKGDQAIRNRDWKFILSHDSNIPEIQKSELYDIRNDPKEKNNLSSTKKALVKKFRSEIGEILQHANGIAIEPEEGLISEKSIKQLKTLGYIK